MKITAKVFKNNGEGSIKAGASITIEDAFVVTGLKVIDSKNGLFVSMPNYKTKNGEYKDSCFPLSKELRTQIQETVLKEYGGDAKGFEGEVVDDSDSSDPFPF